MIRRHTLVGRGGNFQFYEIVTGTGTHEAVMYTQDGDCCALPGCLPRKKQRTKAFVRAAVKAQDATPRAAQRSTEQGKGHSITAPARCQIRYDASIV